MTEKRTEKLREERIRFLFPVLWFVVVGLLICRSPAAAEDGGIQSLREMGKAFASVAKKVSPAVVFIQVEKKVPRSSNVRFFTPFGEGPFGDDFLRRFFGIPFPEERAPKDYGETQPPQERVVGQGSGFIISRDGYIMTNNHVVSGADRVTVRLLDGRQFQAKIVGTDPHSDVAVIKIDGDDLPVLPLGDSDSLEVGEWVLAIGNPFGLSHTLTAGVVSAKGRSRVGITDYEDFIQTDAAINPGNSGGPLVNLDGKAVGMNTAIFSRSGGYMGIGFAIPINMAKGIADQLIKHGSVTRGYLGVLIQDLTPDLARSFGLKDQKGVLVAQVTEGSPAEKAGLKQGDIIIEFGGKPVKEVTSFRNRVALIPPGTEEKITVLRDGEKKTLTITVGKLPEGGGQTASAAHSLEKLGLTVKTLTKDLAEQLGYQGETGVVVTRVREGSLAALAGIKPGALIQEVNRKRVRNVEEFKEALRKTPESGMVLLLLREGAYSRYVALRMEE